MNIDNLIKILEYLQHECDIQSQHLIMQDEYMVSMKYYGACKAYENVISIIKDEAYRNTILEEMSKKK